jgi:hypothetical protein
MDSNDPSSCCFLVSRRDHPVHLIDAVTGTLRCSYVIRNHLDVVEAPISVAFNLAGNKIYAGGNRTINVFDVNAPGSTSKCMATTPSRSAATGQKG